MHLLRTRGRVRLLAVSIAMSTIGLLVYPAQADDPPFVGWSQALPPITWQYVASSSDDCVAGRITCVDRTVREMQRRFDPLAAECAHSAVFSLAYLRTTEAYRSTSQTAGYYRDPAFVNYEDAAFAAMYFSAYDHWTAGRVAYVPPAWRIALDAGARRQVSGMGDLLLGMNAHVNRDLPFVLAQIGPVAPDGSSRKADHDRINVMLNHVVQPLIAEAAARFDPQIETARTPYGVGYTGLLQALVVWRESAWRQAELLVSAPDDATRATIARTIEETAAVNARAIVTATSYLPPLTTTTPRDQYCADHADAGN